MNLMVTRLFGTDGIRGKVDTSLVTEEEAIENLHSKRQISPSLFRLLGEVLGRIHDLLPGQGREVVIGWDQRPNNELLAEYLTLGLQISGMKVTHIGICATPTLHYATLHQSARIGCMITASHNPVSDSGLKVFNSDGYKTSPDIEDQISELAENLAKEEREIDSIEHRILTTPSEDLSKSDWAKKHHISIINDRFEQFKNLFGGLKANQKSKFSMPLLLDSSKGFASEWLASWINENIGIECKEISKQAAMLNHHCGAGEISPTQTWTFEQASQENHILINQLVPAEPGTIVAAALDGDGDRCLIIQATSTGFKVVDGDEIADLAVNAGTISGQDWILAASIESDLSLLSNLDRFPSKVRPIETAVGDRWLSFALCSHLLDSNNPDSLPRVIGVEDSGHIVLPSRHPQSDINWTLVGDGAMTLVAFLLAFSNHDPKNSMNRGWKKRVSAQEVNRELWDGNNSLADEVENIAKDKLGALGNLKNWKRSGLDGEPNLMLIHANLDSEVLSLGIRNSGTQAKISVSLRLSSQIEIDGINEVVEYLAAFLKSRMS